MTEEYDMGCTQSVCGFIEYKFSDLASEKSQKNIIQMNMKTSRLTRPNNPTSTQISAAVLERTSHFLRKKLSPDSLIIQ